MKLFELPKTLGEYDDISLTVGIGRFGPYLKAGDKFVSLPKGEAPLDISLERAIELYEEKKRADAPLFTYKNLPITKGTGRFGPFLKWNDMFINIPKKYNPESLTLEEAIELIEAKSEKESNRFIHNFEAEKITVENGRWGPFIRFGKSMINVKKDGKKITAEEAAFLTLEEVKKMVEEEIPDAFTVKKKATTAKKK